MRLNRLILATLALLAISCLSAFASAPTVGQSAPALTFTDLLQAPAGAKTDWPSLRGKVVVLEFWATWCGGCVEEIPHLNSLIQSLDPNKVQFISVDDEDPAVVKKFLAKMPIGGWLGFDTSKKIIDAYNANVRPRTVVVDPQGRIAGILSPFQLTKEQLVALADGKPVTFPADKMEEFRQQALNDNAFGTIVITEDVPLFEISIRPGDSAGHYMVIHRPGMNGGPSTNELKNATVQQLFLSAFDIHESRLVIHGNVPKRKYSMRVSTPEDDLKPLAPALQTAVLSATGMKATHVTTMEEAYVLQATPQAASHLQPSTFKQDMCFYSAGKLVIMQTGLDDLATQLEDILGHPVVNETGINGNFDANFDLPQGDAEAAKAALEKNLGLTLVKAKRNIERVVLEAPPAVEKAGKKTAAADKPATAPDKPAPKL